MTFPRRLGTMGRNDHGLRAVTRRATLEKLGAGAVGTLWGVTEARGRAQSNTLTVTKQGARDWVARYEVTVTSGTISATDDVEDHGTDDISDDRRIADGRVGPRHGRDQLRYSGWIDEFDLYGPAVVYVNGKERDPYLLGS